MAACSLAEALRRCRELIPEAIEIDAFATLHEPFHIGTAKSKMPKQGVLEDFIPGADAGQRRIDQDEMRYAGTVRCCERITDHVADVVRHERSAVDLESIQNPCDIARLRPLVITAGRA